MVKNATHLVSTAIVFSMKKGLGDWVHCQIRQLCLNGFDIPSEKGPTLI